MDELTGLIAVGTGYVAILMPVLLVWVVFNYVTKGDKAKYDAMVEISKNLENESDINLGYYHQSNIGLLKHVYRRGLKVRYGPTMQCVSGMHYNFSIRPESLSIFTQSNEQKNIDEAYLGLVRNFKRIFWFILSQFGQTNIVDTSFIKGRKHNLEELNHEDMYLKDATSLRMSEIG